MASAATPSTLHELARRFTKRGLRVFPVSNKRPVRGIRGYHGDGPYSLEEIDALPWEHATHLGLVIPCGYIVLDVDAGPDKFGFAQLSRLEDRYGVLPETLTQRTPNGGEHRLFRMPDLGDALTFRSHVLVPGLKAAESNIDIIRSGHRYATVYEAEILLDGLDEVAELPMAWLPAVLRQASERHPLRDMAPRIRGGRAHALNRIEQVAHVPIGHRNETLFGVSADLVKFGLLGKDEEHALRKAALDSGLDAEEVAHAIEQGMAAGYAQREPYDIWFAAHEPQICAQPPRVRYMLDAARRHIARTLLVANRKVEPGEPISGYFSGRSLAYALGISPASGHRLLTTLVKLGALKVVERGSLRKLEAAEYALVGTDVDTNWSTHAPSSLVSSSEVCVLHIHPGLDFPDLVTLPALLEHNVCRNTRDGGLSLSKGIAFTLYTIMEAGDGICREDLATFTGFSEATARGHLAVLIDFGFVDVTAYGHMRIATDDVFHLLDALERTAIVPDRRSRQAAAMTLAREALKRRKAEE